MTLTPSANVWAKALASGIDTIILLAVNDDYYNDTAGFHHNPGTALNVATGEVLARCKQQHRAQDFVAFLREIEASEGGVGDAEQAVLIEQELNRVHSLHGGLPAPEP